MPNASHRHHARNDRRQCRAGHRQEGQAGAAHPLPHGGIGGGEVQRMQHPAGGEHDAENVDDRCRRAEKRRQRHADQGDRDELDRIGMAPHDPDHPRVATIAHEHLFLLADPAGLHGEPDQDDTVQPRIDRDGGKTQHIHAFFILRRVMTHRFASRRRSIRV